MSLLTEGRYLVLTPHQDLGSYLKSKGQEWSGAAYVVPALVAEHVRSSGSAELAAEFQADVGAVCAFVANRQKHELVAAVISALDLFAPELADVADIVVGGLQIACGVRDERRRGGFGGLWLIAGGALAAIVGGIALLRRRH
jgi:hypothetical protein